MPIKVSKFIWENDPKAKPRKSPKAETIKEDDKYINLTSDGTLKVEKSQYTMDMLGLSEDRNSINTTADNKKE